MRQQNRASGQNVYIVWIVAQFGRNPLTDQVKPNLPQSPNTFHA